MIDREMPLAKTKEIFLTLIKKQLFKSCIVGRNNFLALNLRSPDLAVTVTSQWQLRYEDAILK
jgi:hypothetical protein